MEDLPDLNRLSVAQKDDLIRALWPLQKLVRDLSAQVVALELKVKELEARLAQNSRNSSKPPSTDGLNKPKPKSLRPKGQRPCGGQKGHEGHRLKQVAHPDEIIEHRPALYCDRCHTLLPEASVVERRQVFDLPALKSVVTEHRVLAARCPCGKICRAEYPAGINSPVQYGASVLATAVHLTHHHMMPIQRTARWMNELFHLPISEASVLAACQAAQRLLQPSVEAIGQAMLSAALVHADETGLRVAGSLHWMHALATPTLTWLGCHPKRGRHAFEAFDLLPHFRGTLIHDGWKPYRELSCQHGLCNAHHLRELTYLFEEHREAWAGQMIDLLKEASQAVNKAQGTLLPEAQRLAWRTRYTDILNHGKARHRPAKPSGRRGPPRQSKATNLLCRLENYAEDVWRFASEPGVPFTNNIAEQAVRMPKVKQKISGCFRTTQGADIFCTIRSYLASLHKQGANLFQALVLTFQGNPPMPCLA